MSRSIADLVVRGGAVAALALPALAAPSLQAQGAPATFSVCYVPVVGALYRIKAPGLPAECLDPSHVEFAWTDAGDAIRVGDPAGGDLGGAFPDVTVAGIQGRPVAAAAPTAGQAIVFDGTGWVPTSLPTGVTDHGALTGLTDDDHPPYVLADGVRNTVDGFAVTGAFGTGSIPLEGAGVRLMWYPGKAAFRAGQTMGTQWNDASIGQASVALGSQATASGSSSTALGASTNASGVASTAMGFATNAGGQFSTAMGSFASTQGAIGAFVYGDNSTANTTGAVVNAVAQNSFTVRASGGYYLFSSSDLSTGVILAPNSGSWAMVSDRNVKRNFRDESGERVLAAIAEIPIQSWNYVAGDPAIRHLGPAAQDFYAAFGLGTDDRTIHTVDIAGINLLAVQTLETRTGVLKAQLSALADENRALRARLAALEEAVEVLQSAEDRNR
jgi:hypothetical protein